jgi:hypothetical protein
MERPCRYHLAQISVFFEHICNGHAPNAVTDIIFLTKIQKRENRRNDSPL